MRVLLAAVLFIASFQPAAAQTVARVRAAAPQGTAVGMPLLPMGAFSGPTALGSPAGAGLTSSLPGLTLPDALPAGRVSAPTVSALSAAAAPRFSAALPAAAPTAGLAPATKGQARGAVLASLGETRAALAPDKGAAAPDTAERGDILRRLFDSGRTRGSINEQTPPVAAPRSTRREDHQGLRRAPDKVPQSTTDSRLSFIKQPSVVKALTATALFKISMETLAITVPLLALEVFGSATWLATMAAAWGGAMTLSSLVVGGRVDRYPVSRIMGVALASQAVLVGAMAALFITGAATPWVILPLHALSGAAMGVILTGRDTLPARLLGRNHQILSKFDAVVHIIYEVAGTIAPLVLGLLITGFGLKYALLMHPPAALLAALLFFRVKLLPGSEARPPDGAAEGSRRPLLRSILSDIKEGSRFFRQSRAFAWLGFMLLMPMVIHRVFEQMVVPVFVKIVLETPQASAWIVSASNFGELLGALLLLKYMLGGLGTFGKTKKSPFRFMRLMAMGTLAVWCLNLSNSLWIIAPAVFLMALTWAANDLSMTAYFQSRLPEKSAGKAIGFLMAAELGVIMTLNYLIGVLFDLVPTMAGVTFVAVLCTALAYLFWKGKARLKDLTKSGELDVPAPPAP